MENKITFTEAQLAAALAQWEQDAKAGKWPALTDETRPAHSANYLIGLMNNQAR